MPNKRKTIPKKIRFEVFKRDSFTCQYCGKKAPEIVLEVDHIDPVANGGTGDIMNLITACEGCNAGKSDKLLSDNTVIEKQQEQLEKLQERREQLDMLMQWKESLLELNDYETDKLIEFINNRIVPHGLVPNKAKAIIGGWKKKFGFDVVLSAIEISAGQYLTPNPEGYPTEESTQKMLEKIPGICYNEKKYRRDPEAREVDYLRYEMQRRGMYVNIGAFYTLVNKARKSGVPIANIKGMTETIENWTAWKDAINSMLTEVQDG